jgi:hypothetical protein
MLDTLDYHTPVLRHLVWFSETQIVLIPTIMKCYVRLNIWAVNIFL